MLWLMLALTVFTAIQRFVMVWRQATTTPARSGPRLAERWSGLRPSVGFGIEGRRQRLAGQTGPGRWRARRATPARAGTWRRARPRP
jgi:hypothetical protein